MAQNIQRGPGSIQTLPGILKQRDVRMPLLVCGATYQALNLEAVLHALSIHTVRFQGFSSNPRYEDILSGVSLFLNEGCDAIIAIGGGSAIDTAKCIRHFSDTSPDADMLREPRRSSQVPLIAIPTTAGTGSESTRFAVIYRNNIKQTVTHDRLLPDDAILDAALLRSLPVYPKTCALLDALCQGIESWWAAASTEESILYAQRAVTGIIQHMDRYLSGRFNPDTAQSILNAANDAGQAIHITMTTAPHGLSYMLTTLYGLPHGHAVAILLPAVWRYMLAHPDDCTDRRGRDYLSCVFQNIANAMNASDALSAIDRFQSALTQYRINPPRIQAGHLHEMAASVSSTVVRHVPPCPGRYFAGLGY